MTRTSASRRFVWTFLLTLAGTLGAVSALNIIADPFDFFRPAVDGTLDPYKKRSATRYARANVVASGDWDLIFCGASRTEIGFDPGHPALAGQRVYNFGLVAAKYPEIWWAARFAIESNPKLLELWIELDPSYLIHKPPNSDFLTSRYGPCQEPVNYALGQLFGSLTTERSASALSKWWNDEPADDYYTPLGVRVRPMRSPKAIPWDWFEKELAQTRSQRESQTIAHRAAKGHPYAPWLDLTFLDDFPQLVEIAHGQGTRVRVIVPPSHLVRIAQFVEEGWFPQINEFKWRMSQLAGDAPRLADGRPALVVHDFLVDCEANAEPLPRTAGRDTKWHWEGGHFRVELGNQIIDQIMPGDDIPPGAFGATLTPESIESHLLTSNRSLAQRLPTIPIVQESMNAHLLVKRLESSPGPVLASETEDQHRVNR